MDDRPRDRRGGPRPSTGAGWAAGAIALLLPVAFSPALRNGFFVPRYVLLVVVGAATLPLVIASARTSRAGRLAMALVTWAALSAALNPEPVLSLLGRWNQGIGWVFFLAAVGLWAAGTRLQPADRGAVRAALLLGAGANAVVMVLASVADLTPYGIGQVGGRSVALLGNPVHVGAFMVSSLALLGDRSHQGRRGMVASAALAALLGLGLGLSGSRAALLGLPIVAVGLWRGLGWRRASALVALSAVAVLGSAGLDARGQDAASRIATAGGNASERPGAWATAVDAIADRPLFGRGPGRFREATTEHRTKRNLAESSDTYFDDAHNAPLELATTLGIPGMLLAMAFVGVAARRAGGPFAWFALAALPYLLLQPLTVAFTPLILLALGSAGAEGSSPVGDRLPRPAIALGVAAGAAAAVFAGAVLTGAHFLKRTYQEFERSDAQQAERLLRPWPEGATGRGQPAAFRSSRSNPDAVDEGIHWYREAARRNPDDPQLWAALADYELSFGRLDDAERHYERLLERDPVSLRARWGLAIIAAERGDLDDAGRLLDEAATLRPAEGDTERLRERLLG